MGTYNEPRPPSGAPTDGEHDVWLDGGTIKWGHWNAATSAWVVDATADSDGLVGAKGPDGDPCPTGGEADTLDGKHASEFMLAEDDGWHNVTSFYNSWSLPIEGGGYCKYRKRGGWVYVSGNMLKNTVLADIDKPAFILPEGYRCTFPLAPYGITHSPGSGGGYIRYCQTSSSGYVSPHGVVDNWVTFSLAFPLG